MDKDGYSIRKECFLVRITGGIKQQGLKTTTNRKGCYI